MGEFNIQGLLAIAIPSLIALVGVILANVMLRRTARERNQQDREVAEDATEVAAGANETNAFTAVTNQLFKDNELLRADVKELRADGKELRAEMKEVKLALQAKDERITYLEDQNEQTDAQRRHQIGITRQLSNYNNLLIQRWPISAGPPPEPQPFIDWTRHL